MFGEVKGPRRPGRPRSSRVNDAALRDRQYCGGRPYRDAQDTALNL